MQTLKQLFEEGVPNLDDEGDDVLRHIRNAIVPDVADALSRVPNASTLSICTVLAGKIQKIADLMLSARGARICGQTNEARTWDRLVEREYDSLPNWARW